MKVDLDIVFLHDLHFVPGKKSKIISYSIGLDIVHSKEKGEHTLFVEYRTAER